MIKAKPKAKTAKKARLKVKKRRQKRQAKSRPMFEDSPVVSVSRACGLLDCGPTKLYELLAEGRVKALKAGDRTLVVKQSCFDYLDTLPAYDPQ